MGYNSSSVEKQWIFLIHALFNTWIFLNLIFLEKFINHFFFWSWRFYALALDCIFCFIHWRIIIDVVIYFETHCFFIWKNLFIFLWVELGEGCISESIGKSNIHKLGLFWSVVLDHLAMANHIFFLNSFFNAELSFCKYGNL